MGGSGTSTGSRKSHTKSRKGCKTCKRRHIRCDETIPQCKNCTKHSVRCDYMDSPFPLDDGSSTPLTPLTPSIMDHSLSGYDWHGMDISSGSLIHPMQVPAAMPSTQEAQWLRQISMLSSHLRISDTRQYAVWTTQIPFLRFLRIATQHDFVMEAILSLLTYHDSWSSEDAQAIQTAYHHRGVALSGLQVALSNFSRDNADAVLAASILLSWQASDWQSWSSFMQGTTIVVDQMRLWRSEAEFGEFMEELDYLSCHDTNPRARLSPVEEQNIISTCYSAMEQLLPFIHGKSDETKAYNTLLSFLQKLEAELPFRTSEMEFGMIHHLRAWLFFMPLNMLRRTKREPALLMLMANFYGVLLAMEPLFPSVGLSYFGPLAIAPIEQIYGTIEHHMQTGEPNSIGWDVLMKGMTFPLDQVHQYRLRRGWTQRIANTLQIGTIEDFLYQVDLADVMPLPYPSLEIPQQQSLLRPPSIHSELGLFDSSYGTPGHSPLLAPYSPSPYFGSHLTSPNQYSPNQLSPSVSPHLSPSVSPFLAPHSPHSPHSSSATSPQYFLTESPGVLTTEQSFGVDRLVTSSTYDPYNDFLSPNQNQAKWDEVSKLNAAYQAGIEGVKRFSGVWA